MRLFLRSPVLAAAALFAVSGPGASAQGEGSARAGMEEPAWVHRPFFASGQTRVAAIEPAGAVDVVVFAEGLNQGFRPGMPCVVLRGGEPIAELVVADVRPATAAGLILELAAGAVIEPGDIIRIQTR